MGGDTDRVASPEVYLFTLRYSHGHYNTKQQTCISFEQCRMQYSIVNVDEELIHQGDQRKLHNSYVFYSILLHQYTLCVNYHTRQLNTTTTFYQKSNIK